MDKTPLSTKEKLIKHMISISFLGSVSAGILTEIFFFYHRGALDIAMNGIIIGIFLIHPAALTLLNLFFLAANVKRENLRRKGKHIEYLTLGLGSLYSIFLFLISNIQLSDWNQVLQNAQKHTPIWTGGWAVTGTLAVIGICGYLFLSAAPIRKVPPLVSVCAIAAMYLGMAECILWILQIFQWDIFMIYLCLFPLNCIILGAKTVRYKIWEWKSDQSIEELELQNQYLSWLNRSLLKAEHWPLAAFLLMWPLLGIIICILILFGQQPDRIIRAWTETSDWNLSVKEALPNVYYDEHYLCTVAAGGHPKIVKPIRMGSRHGHRVVVNRQLCIANAFEQILEERTPCFHRHLRRFYDTYGFPVARMIRSPYAADIIYLMMKPLEWLFLIVLYSCDVKPENRIAVQYMEKRASG